MPLISGSRSAGLNAYSFTVVAGGGELSADSALPAAVPGAGVPASAARGCEPHCRPGF